MTDSPGPDTTTTNVARKSHYAAAVEQLDRCATPAGGGYSDPADVALAHATMLLANEARVANLIAYLAVVTAPGATPDASLVRELESRIDAALGTTTTDAARG